MLRQVEHGIMFRLRDYWGAHRPECLESDYNSQIDVGIEELSCALVVLAIGIQLSLIILVLEKIRWNYWNRNRLNEENVFNGPILPYLN